MAKTAIKKSNPRILLYGEHPASIGSLKPALTQSFQNAAIDIEICGLKNLKQNLRRKHLAFVLPGIIGPDSPYPDKITPDIIKTIHKKIENGMIGIFICAGAAFFSRETHYDPPWGKAKQRQQLNPLFNGIAKGPIPALAKKPGEGVSDINLAKVEYTDNNGNTKTASVYYGNGTYFLPDDKDDPNLKVIARFKDVEGKPPAIIRIQKGKGFAYLMAVHPEIGHFALSQDSGLRRDEQFMSLYKQLEQNEPDRKELWATIMDDIIDHSQKIKAPKPPLRS